MNRTFVFTLLCIGLAFALVACPVSEPTGTSDFALKLESSNVSAFQGSSRLLHVTLERKNGFVAEVEIGLQNPPNGITASTTTIRAGTEAQLAINLASDVPIGALGVMIVGTSGTQVAKISLTLNVQVITASSQTLIQQALEAGLIDLSTSFVYRAYALFGDGRLPAEFTGSGSNEEDDELFLEIEQSKASLPSTTLDLLRPYIVRPNDPQSAWSVGAGRLRSVSDPVLDSCKGRVEDGLRNPTRDTRFVCGFCVLVTKEETILLVEIFWWYSILPTSCTNP